MKHSSAELAPCDRLVLAESDVSEGRLVRVTALIVKGFKPDAHPPVREETRAGRRVHN